jgi:hypothetical protein
MQQLLGRFATPKEIQQYGAELLLLNAQILVVIRGQDMTILGYS